MVFIIFWKNIKLQYRNKKSAGVPKLGKSRTLTGVSLEIQYFDALADVPRDSWVQIPLPAFYYFEAYVTKDKMVFTIYLYIKCFIPSL